MAIAHLYLTEYFHLSMVKCVKHTTLDNSYVTQIHAQVCNLARVYSMSKTQ